MKKKLLYFVIILGVIFSSCHKQIYLFIPRTDGVEELIQSAKNYTDNNGLKQGLWKINRITLDKSRYISSVGYYKDDFKNGKWIYILKSGNIHTIRHYKQDTLHGYSLVYRAKKHSPLEGGT